MEFLFTYEQYLAATEEYNRYVFPFQVILLIGAIVATALVFTKIKNKSAAVGIILGTSWLWSGIFFHILYLSSLTLAGYFTGGIVILQGIFLFYEALFRNSHLEFKYERSGQHIAGFILVVTGLIIYPLIGVFDNREISKAIVFGLPCTTTIATFGFFMMTGKKFPLYLLVIPSLWAMIGFLISLHILMYEDILLLAAAILADSWLLWRKKYDKVKKAPLE